MTDEPDVRRDDTAYTKLTTKVKRGTGTRDQDTTKLVTRHPDPMEAATRHQKAIAAVRATADASRTIQPEADDE
jgi:hypothetical protein